MSRQQGFTLIEIMVSLSLGLFLTSFGLQAIVSINEQYAYIKHVSRVQETARFAFELLERDIQQSRNWRKMISFSQLSGSSAIETTKNFSCEESNTTWVKSLKQAVYATNDTANNYECVNNDDYLHGDLLTLRGLLPDTSINFDDQQFYLRHSATLSTLFTGKDRNLPENLITNTTTQQVFARSYYIGDSQRSCSNNIIPALFWQTMVNGRPVQQELLAGIEHLQIEFMIDGDNDGIVDKYVSPSDNQNWQNIKLINVTILVRSICPLSNFKNTNSYQLGNITYDVNDAFYRQQYEFSFSY